MNKIYLVILEMYENEENSIINIHSSRESAEKTLNLYIDRTKDIKYSKYSYRIDEVDLTTNKDILWDCYKNRAWDYE